MIDPNDENQTTETTQDDAVKQAESSEAADNGATDNGAGETE